MSYDDALTVTHIKKRWSLKNLVSKNRRGNFLRSVLPAGRLSSEAFLQDVLLGNLRVRGFLRLTVLL